MTALVAAALAAVQLLPAVEFVRTSTRAAAGLDETQLMSPRTLLRAIGPSPDGVKDIQSWESCSGLGVVWVAIAFAAPAVTAGRARNRARWALAIILATVVTALFGAVVFHGLPIVRMFRQPARMFLIAAIPVAYLAGLTTQALLDRSSHAPKRWARARQIAVRVAAGMIAIVVLGIVVPRGARCNLISTGSRCRSP